ncbi:MAG: protease pro-enzyme activation domain-containing protein [Terriglobales bacterium]
MSISRVRVFVSLIALLVVSLLLTPAMFARVTTSVAPTPRVTKKVDATQRTAIPGHVSAAVKMANDLGRQHPDTPSPGMLMILKSSEEQKREIRKVIDEQQDKRTVNYHQWVTPEEFGEHFGVHDSDIAKISAWLQSEGFTVDEVSKSKRVIKFSGNIGQVEHAFQTEMHLYSYQGELHVANNKEISVPEAFSKVVGGVTLNNFYRKASFDRHKMIKFGPKYTSSSSVHYVGPADFATIYNTAPLLAQGITGSGETIAIVGRSDILMSDVESYRQLFNLPPNDPTFIHAGQDNGTQPGDDGESDLDVEISGGMAPSAKVDFVIGTPTFLVDGITNSIEYIVENNLSDIMSISYGSCEAVEGVGGNAFNSQAFEQAAAQGISVFIASGDNGPAECDDQNDSLEVLGYAAGAESSTPYSVAVGGTELAGECATFGVGCSQSNYAKYWGTSTNGYYLSSALEYIPEVPWNEGKGSISNSDASSSLSGLWSSSGGISSYYMRPSWQMGANSAILASSTDPSYASYLSGSGGSITVTGGNWVAGVTLTNPGSGYTASTTTVTFSGGTCTTAPATGATANISGGAVASSGGLASINFAFGTQGGTVTAGQGLNCTVAPTVTFGAAPAGGTTATGTVVLGPMIQTQPLVAGVPHRLTPDFALNAADGHDATLFCSEGACEFTTTNGQNTISDAGLVGGTSVAAPSMAGIQALINQYNAVNNPEPGNPTGRQGMPGYVYYGLAAAQNDTTCAASALVPPNSANTTSCAFQDIQAGNTYICGTSTCTSSSGTKIGWPAGVGFDLATGLGSVNAYNMATQWSSVVFNSTSTTLNAPVQSCSGHGCAVTLSGTVSGTGTPTGDVAFIVSQGEIGDPVNQTTGAFVYPGAFATLSGGSFSATLNNLPAGVNYNITARYGGDGTNASSVSSPQAISVSSEPVTITITPGVINLLTCTITNGSTFTYGQFIWAQVSVAGVSGYGVPTGTVTITDSINGGLTNNVTTVTLDPNGNGYLVAGNVGTASNSCLYDYLFSQAPMFSGGTHSVSATYSGDNTFQSGSAATPASITVSQIATAPTLAAGATLITSGTATNLYVAFPTVTALSAGSLTPGASGPTGTVTFTDTTTSTVLGTATVVPSVTYVGGSSSAYPSWTYAASALGSVTGITTTGANSITATYSGDSNYNGTTTTAATVTVGTGTATTTTVTSSANPTTINGRPTFTATMTGAPTAGTVTFYDATYGLTLGTGTVGTAHTATFRPASGYPFLGGSHNIVAQFGGNATFMASTSAALVQTVTKGAGAVLLAGKQADVSGNTYTFSAVFTPSPSSTGFEPTLGVMTFYDAVNGGTATAIATAVPNDVYASQGGYGLWTASGSATLSTPGTHVITAQYNDVNYLSAVSNSMTVYVTNTGNANGLYFPLPGSTLGYTGSTVYKWFPNAANAAGSYFLELGSTPGGHDYYQSGNLGNALTVSVANSVLPINGSTVYATLYYLVHGVWQNVPATYTAYTGTAAAITSPTPNSTLTGSSATFTWTAGTNATAYGLNIGSAPGGNQYYSSGSLGNVLTKAVTGLPTDGSMIYVTLFADVNGTWLTYPYTYTAFNAGAAQGVLTSPTPNSTLTGSTVTFNWTAGSGATAYAMDIGNVAGGNQYYQSGNLGNVLTTTANSLPTNGSTVYVTLYSLVGGNWLNTGYTYTAFNLAGASGVLTTPMPGTTLTSGTVTFSWTTGAGASAYWLDMGNTPGGSQYFQSGNLGNVTSTIVSGLPTDGSMIYATLYSLVGANWVANAYTYTALNATSGLAVVFSPVNLSTITGGSVTFSWTADPNASAYWVDVSNVTAGANDLDQSGNLGNVPNYTIYNLPQDGSTIYVTLYSYVGGQWLYTSTSYISGSGDGPKGTKHGKR